MEVVIAERWHGCHKPERNPELFSGLCNGVVNSRVRPFGLLLPNYIKFCSCSPCIGRGEPYKQDLNPMGFIPSARLAEQMRQQSLRSCESLDDEMGTGSSIASLRSAKSAWEMNSWELDASEVQICLDSKNRPWQLGSGGFGSVSIVTAAKKSQNYKTCLQ